MLTVSEIKTRLKDRRIAVVAQATGLHENTIRDITSGRNDNPKIKVVEALSDYLEPPVATAEA